jgi:hypothetical protein
LAETATACHSRFVVCIATPSIFTVDDAQFAPVFDETYKYPPLTHVTWIAPVSAATAMSCQLRGVVVFALAFPSMVTPVFNHVDP